MSAPNFREFEPLSDAMSSMLSALSIPVPEALPEDLEDTQDGREWCLAPRFVTDDVARSLWLEWNSDDKARIEDRKFLREFRDLLRNAVSLGWKVDRLSEAARSLPIPSENALNWIGPFERSIEDAETFGIRLFLSPKQNQEYRRGSSESTADSDSWNSMLGMMTDGLFYELGLVFPPVKVMGDDTISGSDFRVEWNDLVLPVRKGLAHGRILVNDTVDRLTLLNIEGEEAVNPANGAECAIVDDSYKSVCEDAGLTTWDSRGYSILSLSAAIRNAAASFVARPLVDLYLLRLSEFDSESVQLLDRTRDRDFLTSMLRSLLSEEISIRDLSSILTWFLAEPSVCRIDLSRYMVFAITDVLVSDVEREKMSVQGHVEHVRNALKRYISHKFTRGGNTLVVYLLDPELEKFIAEADELQPCERRIILKAVRDEIGNLPPTADRPVVLTSMEIRHKFRTAIAPEIANLAVLSYQELSPDMNIQPIARITADDLEHAPFFQLLDALSSECFERLARSKPAVLDTANEENAAVLMQIQEELLDKYMGDIALKRPMYAYTRKTWQAIGDFAKVHTDAFLELAGSTESTSLDEVYRAVARHVDGSEPFVPLVHDMGLKLSLIARHIVINLLVDRDGDRRLSIIHPLVEKIDLAGRLASKKWLYVTGLVGRRD